MKKISVFFVLLAAFTISAVAVSAPEASAHRGDGAHSRLTGEAGEDMKVRASRYQDIQAYLEQIRSSIGSRSPRSRGSSNHSYNRSRISDRINQIENDTNGGEADHGEDGHDGDDNQEEQPRKPRVIPPPTVVEQPEEEDLPDFDIPDFEDEEEEVDEQEDDDINDGSLYSDAFAEELAHEIHRLTNIERNKAGLPSLAWDNDLVRIAIGHSQDMVDDDFFAHTHPNGCTLTCRFDRAGYTAWAWGENIAYIGTSNTQGLAARFIQGWMDSPGHRRNILSDNYTHQGIGVVISGRYHYATANFADPR